MLRAIAILAVIAAGLASGFFHWLTRGFDQPGPAQSDIVLVLPKGEGLSAIAARLKEAGVLVHEWPFAVGVWRAGSARSLKAGEYRFPAAVTPRGVMDLLIEGRVVVRRLTVPEGLTAFQIAVLVNGAEAMSGQAEPAAEGSLLPDTYHYAWGDDRAAMVQRLRRAMTDTLAELWAKRAANLPLKTPEEAVVLASIVERETGIAAERPLVAGVFINRLRRGMRLQSDPTVSYGISPQAPLDRALSRADLAQAHRWNTYVIDGLPPTPIANPGRASLEAVLNPAATDALYFVADGSGGHAFARTLDEHNRNVAKWRAQRAATPAP
jgi:UPF0755 protein